MKTITSVKCSSVSFIHLIQYFTFLLSITFSPSCVHLVCPSPAFILHSCRLLHSIQPSSIPQYFLASFLSLLPPPMHPSPPYASPSIHPSIPPCLPQPPFICPLPTLTSRRLRDLQTQPGLDTGRGKEGRGAGGEAGWLVSR